MVPNTHLMVISNSVKDLKIISVSGFFISDLRKLITVGLNHIKAGPLNYIKEYKTLDLASGYL